MRIHSEDEEYSVDVGTGSFWNSVYSTALVRLSSKEREENKQAMQFLKTGECEVQYLKETEIELKRIQDVFSKIPANDSVYDWRSPEKDAPWKNRIADCVTSCANLYTTAEGDDLFEEVFHLIAYAEKNKVAIIAG